MVEFTDLRKCVLRAATSLIAVALVSGCASKPPASDMEAVRAYEEINDPLEPWNRAMLQLDQGLDTVLFDPTIAVYKTFVPEPGRRGVSNFLRNFRSPITLVNDVLQGEGERAGITTGRFVINSTIGFFGFFDVAQRAGLPYHSEDFGQTLAVWGVGDGPYLYVPILGPSGVRDLTGYGVDAFSSDPMAWVGYADNPLWWNFAYFYGVAADLKYQAGPTLDELQASSIDYYAALRAAYRQNRAAAIRNGAPAPAPLLDEFDDDGDPFTKRDNRDADTPEQVAAQ